MTEQIKRLIPRNGSAMYVTDDGPYMSYADHVAAITQLQQQVADLTAERVAIAKAALEAAAKVSEGGVFLCDDAPDARFGRECASAIRRVDPATIVAKATPKESTLGEQVKQAQAEWDDVDTYGPSA